MVQKGGTERERESPEWRKRERCQREESRTRGRRRGESRTGDVTGSRGQTVSRVGSWVASRSGGCWWGGGAWVRERIGFRILDGGLLLRQLRWLVLLVILFYFGTSANRRPTPNSPRFFRYIGIENRTGTNFLWFDIFHFSFQYFSV